MNSLILTSDNNNAEVITNTLETSDDSNIKKLTEDCVFHIVSHIDNTADINSCKCLSKRFCSLIEHSALVEKLFFSKSCISPKSFLAFSCDYLLYIENQLKQQQQQQQQKTTTINNEGLYANKDNILLKKKLFFSIEKNLAQATAIDLKSIATIRYDGGINCIAFSQSNNLFANVSSDNSVKICQLINGSWQQLYELNHNAEVKKIIFSPDGCYIITSSNFKNIIWELSTISYKPIYTTENVYSSYIYFRDDSKRLFIKSTNSPIQIFDLIDNQWICVLSIDVSELMSCFNVRQGLFVNDKDLLTSSIKNDNWLSFIIKRYAVILMLNGDDCGDKDLATELKDLVHGTYWREMSFLERLGIESRIYSDDMQLIYCCPTAASNIILKYTDNQWQLKLRLDISDYIKPCFSSDNQRIITKYSYKDEQIYQITVWNISGNKAYKELELDKTHLAKFSQDGKYIITAHCDNQLKIWQFIEKEWKIKLAINYKKTINDILFSNYNWMIAVSSSDNSSWESLVNNNSTDIFEVIKM